ncbi:hypothetical protein EGW08_013405, partial [Elysia chlorotica]
LRCSQCAFTTTIEKCLLKHERKCRGEAGIHCPLCAVHYSDSPEELCIHKRRHHRPVKLTCFLCEFKSRSISKLPIHVCKLCLKTMSGETHEDSHWRKAVYACELCSYRAADGLGLRLHVRLHSADGPRACGLCCRKFSQRDHLDSHIGTHTNERPFNCPICDYAAKQMQHLKTHLVTNTCKGPF